MLRIIGGSFKGRLIKAPEGARTRPTSSRVREAVFDILAPRIRGARFLDLYAGSGAIGIEALSRGASFSVFVESDRGTARLLNENILKLGIESSSGVMQMPAEKALRKLAGLSPGFDIIFMDPPYRNDQREKLLDLLFESDILERDALVVIEHATRTKPGLPASFREIKSYVYGDSSLLLAGKAWDH